MSFDPYALLASMMISGIGFALFKYGRGQQRIAHTVIGLSMLLYPYVVDSLGVMCGIFVGMLVLLWAATRLGL